MSNIHVGDGTSPGARYVAPRIEHGAIGQPAGIYKKVGGSNSAHRPQINRNAVNPVWWG